MDTTVHGDLRVSDAERDRALAELSEHFQAGRLDGDEFEERSGLALRARTARELADLFADLPRDRVRAPVPGPVSGTWPRYEGDFAPARFSRGPRTLTAVVAVWLIAFAAHLVTGHHGVGFGGFGSFGGFGGAGLAGIVVVLLVIRSLARRHHGGW